MGVRWEYVCGVMVAVCLQLLVLELVWQAGQSALPPPPMSQHRRPLPRGPAWLYPPPAPLLDLPAVSFLANTATCGTDPLLLVIVVISHPSHVDLRNAHRTHVSEEALDALGARRVFVLSDASVRAQDGYPAVDMSWVLAEAGQHRDLVVANFTEHYRNLTYKHALALSWSSKFCLSARYILKMDDDIMVDVWGIVALLRKGLTVGPLGKLRPSGEGKLLDAEQKWTAGLVQRGLIPQRGGGKWKVTRDEYPKNRYPDFLAGWAYLATRSAVSAILSVATTTPLFWIDDVHMTGTVARAAGVPRYALNHHYSLMSGSASCCLRGSQDNSTWPRSSFAPLCGLLVVPSDKNLTVMREWLGAAKACHESDVCPSTAPSTCPNKNPQQGIGTVIRLN